MRMRSGFNLVSRPGTIPARPDLSSWGYITVHGSTGRITTWANVQYSQTPPVSCLPPGLQALPQSSPAYACVRLTEKKPERWSTSRQIPSSPFGVFWTCSRSSDANPNSDPIQHHSCRLSCPRRSRAPLGQRRTAEVYGKAQRLS